MTTPDREFLSLQAVVAGRYSLLRELGRGGMGIVFLARDVALDRPVAIKLLPPKLAAIPELRERFLREARTAANLSHPNIVPIHAVEERDDIVYFVMGYIDGETLGQRVRRTGPMALSMAAKLVQEIAWALGYAHGRGVVHRDIKPDNVLIDKGSGRALVTDFGIARISDSPGMTGAGELVGTAHYMSPEQAVGEPVDGRSDLYSLGVTAFYALTGELPFDAPTLPAIVAKHVNEPAPRVATRREGIPGKLAEAVDRCLAKDPNERFETGEELAEAIGAALQSNQEVAPEIRALFRQGVQLDMGLGMVSFAVLILPSAGAALWDVDPFAVLLLFFLFSFAIFGPLFTVLYTTRAVLKAGLSATDVAAAVERLKREEQEENELVWRTRVLDPGEYRQRAVWWFKAGATSIAVGLVVGAIAQVLGNSELALGVSLLFSIIGVVGWGGSFLLWMTARLRARPGSKGPRSMAQRLFAGRFSGWLFRIAGIGLRIEQQNEPPKMERTELTLAAAVGDMFAELPGDMQRRFALVPNVTAQLEADAEALRAREVELSRAIAQVNPDGTGDARERLDALENAGGDSHEVARLRRRLATVDELRAARERARDRLESAVAALENMRLDLLRLQAGIGTPDQLTEDLEKAQEVSAAVDAELEGRAEVSEALA